MKYHRFKALGITSSKKPQNTHLWFELDSGMLYLVDSVDNTKIYYSADKGLSWTQLDIDPSNTSGDNKSRDHKIQSAWHDRGNSIIWFIDCENDGIQVDFDVWKLDYSGSETAPSITEIGTSVAGGICHIVYDIFVIGTNTYASVYELEADADTVLKIYDVDTAPFTLKDSITHSPVNIWVNAGMSVVISDKAYFIAHRLTGLTMYMMIYDATGNTLTTHDSFAGYFIGANKSFASLAYDGRNIIHSTAYKDADGLYYSFEYDITADDWSGGTSLTNVALMSDRNCPGVAPNEMEKGFGITNETVYEMRYSRSGIMLLQDCSDLTDANIIAITDNFFMNNDGDMFEYINSVSDIKYMKIIEELYEPSYADIHIKGELLESMKAGQLIKIYDSDGVLSWSGRILYPTSVLVGKTKTIGELKALGINSQENNVYRKNFTTARSSDYIIKDTIDNALPGFYHDDEIDDFSALTYKYDMKTKIRKMFNYLAMLERAVIHYKPDGEIFFNKYNNLSKHPQIYSATYLKDDTVKDYTADPTALDFVDFATLHDGTLAIISSWQSHKNILRLQDDVTAGEDPVIVHTETTATAGTREFYVGTSNVTELWYLYTLESGVGEIVHLRITGSALDYRDSGDTWQEIQAVANDTLYHIKMVWRVDNTFDLYVDGTKKVDNQATNNDQVVGAYRFVVLASGDSEDYFYLDAYGDPDNDEEYTVGQNASAWNQYTSHIRITSYTPAANRHITRTPVIGGYNDLGQVYYVGKASDADVQKYGINELQPWRDPEITNYTEAKQLGDNLLAVYSMDTQMISMLVVGKKHIQVGYTVEVEWSGVFSITKKDFLVTKRIWYPMIDVCNLELTDNILTKKAFNIRVINKFYDEDAQQGYEDPDMSESTMDGTVLSLKSISELRSI